MKRFTLLSLTIAGVLAAGASLAAPGAAGRAAKLDANGDGAIDRTEAAARPWLAAKFDQLDANHDGRISANERPQHGGRGGMAKLDANHDGAIDRSEAQAAPKLAAMFDRIDRNHDGRIDANERPQHGGRGGMAKLDADHDGRVSRAEAANSKLAGRFDQLDANRDGYVDRAELRAAFQRMRGERANGVGSGGTGRG